MINVGGRVLSVEDFSEIVFKAKAVNLDESAVKKVDANFHFLKNFSDEKLIYGINTGFGPMAQYKVSKENVLQLQYNLIRSHSSGAGKVLPAILAKPVSL